MNSSANLRSGIWLTLGRPGIETNHRRRTSTETGRQNRWTTSWTTTLSSRLRSSSVFRSLSICSIGPLPSSHSSEASISALE
ncbi:hypothetical protein AArcMg_4158 (plasmid) [Natrarchaeobaculum sulfurireducens]|uniref:Uncharacterized protein n=1 Tax=Natrarchaeobaculum sulfurireducens TaxID=2044521 RepID=A0A346PKD8_9EURY|nr:hypothetical protein AArc1_5094 [Natrarchaeobaculum sulfurireducens]AXR79983.1 hypothetical protein AArcMg_4158 [Natrarchaeobaculum sulfurireducens]